MDLSFESLSLSPLSSPKKSPRKQAYRYANSTSDTEDSPRPANPAEQEIFFLPRSAPILRFSHTEPTDTNGLLNTLPNNDGSSKKPTKKKKSIKIQSS